MGTPEILSELAKLGSDATRKTLLRHGVREPLYGVKIGDLKKIQKRIKKDHALSRELYNTGNADAMYLAGLIADAQKMKKSDLERWAKSAGCSYLCDYVVAPIAAESSFGAELARKWIDSPNLQIAETGWATWTQLVSTKPDDELDMKEIERLIERVQKNIHQSPDRLRYVMNGFVIGVGASVKPLVAKAKAAAKAIGSVEVDMGDTACRVPNALEYITKVEKMGRLGQKRNPGMC